MINRHPIRWCAIAATICLATQNFACDRKPEAVPTHGATAPAARLYNPPTIASLVPAATDLIIGMDQTSHLVAVSNWDAPQPAIANLPRVGDYRSIDWERLAVLRPDAMITQFAVEKIPPGVTDRAAELNIKLINIADNRLADIFTTLAQLGEAIHDPAAADQAARALHAKLDAVANENKNRAAIRTLIVRSEPGDDLACVGSRNFLDELLTIAGGTNVLAGGENAFPSIDREQLIYLNPDCVIVLLPGAAPQVIAQSQAFWKTVQNLNAVNQHRVYIISDQSALLPGFSVGRLAEKINDLIHESRNHLRATSEAAL